MIRAGPNGSENGWQNPKRLAERLAVPDPPVSSPPSPAPPPTLLHASPRPARSTHANTTAGLSRYHRTSACSTTSNAPCASQRSVNPPTQFPPLDRLLRLLPMSDDGVVSVMTYPPHNRRRFPQLISTGALLFLSPLCSPSPSTDFRGFSFPATPPRPHRPPPFEPTDAIHHGPLTLGTAPRTAPPHGAAPCPNHQPPPSWSFR